MAVKALTISSLLTIEIPRSVLTKMISLRDKQNKIYYYIFNAFIKFFDENSKLQELNTKIQEIKFTIAKEGNDYNDIQIQFYGSHGKRFDVITDASGQLRRRMENFYKFESDIDFFMTVLYFFCKYYNLSFKLISDNLIKNKIQTESTDISNGTHRILKSIYLNLKPY